MTTFALAVSFPSVTGRKKLILHSKVAQPRPSGRLETTARPSAVGALRGAPMGLVRVEFEFDLAFLDSKLAHAKLFYEFHGHPLWGADTGTGSEFQQVLLHGCALPMGWFGFGIRMAHYGDYVQAE